MSKDQRSASNGQGSQHNGGPGSNTGSSQTGPVSLITTGVPLNGEHQLTKQ